MIPIQLANNGAESDSNSFNIVWFSNLHKWSRPTKSLGPSTNCLNLMVTYPLRRASFLLSVSSDHWSPTKTNGCSLL